MKSTMKNENEIVIYTNPDRLKDKMSKRYSIRLWYFHRLPASKKVKRIYFAVKGEVIGSFKVTARGIGKLYFDPRTWRTTRSTIITKPFRGFRYRWW